ncbi:MAG: hypothetical protein JXQ87_11280 [Bacteroidia bacterium]
MSYHKKEWKEFRDQVIELDGFKCVRCGRGKEEVVLQVHHKYYEKGRMPWEYGTEACETLCKGCHAEEHGITKPTAGWEYLGEEDLGDLTGSCEKCGTSIRYVYQIGHPDWGFLEVGTYCCDSLTDTVIASNNRESLTRFRGRLKRFINSVRWQVTEKVHSINQSIFHVVIMEINESHFQITIQGFKSRRVYKTLREAKEKVFNVIESGEMVNYLDDKGIECKA